MNNYISVFLFALGIILVVKGGDLFVDAASWIARAANIPPFIIGATIVSLATTLPEMLVSVMASLEGKNDMAVGNAIGSVTANTGLIMALAIIFMVVLVPRTTYLVQCILLLLAEAVLWIGSLRGAISPWACVILFVIFLLSILGNITQAKRNLSAAERTIVSGQDIAKNIFLFLLGAGGIVVGSEMLIRGGSEIAVLLGVPERVIAVTMVAVGTSLPELVTTLTAIRKKEAHLSVGNIIGANIIDISLILPICSMVSGGSFSVSSQCLQIDFPACFLISLLAILPMILKERAYKVQGVLMLLAYAGYLIITI